MPERNPCILRNDLPGPGYDSEVRGQVHVRELHGHVRLNVHSHVRARSSIVTSGHDRTWNRTFVVLKYDSMYDSRYDLEVRLKVRFQA